MYILEGKKIRKTQKVETYFLKKKTENLFLQMSKAIKALANYFT